MIEKRDVCGFCAVTQLSDGNQTKFWTPVLRLV